MSRESDTTIRMTISKAGTDRSRLRATITVLSGQGAGRLIELTDHVLVIGRGEEASLRLEDESLSRRHVRIALIHGAWFIEDLQSTNGTLLNGEPVQEPELLEDGGKIQLGEHALLRFSLQDEDEYQASRRLYEATVRDALTGCFNRHYLDERLPAEFSYAKRHHSPLAVLFVDADHFKQVNDRWGHPAGDEVLRRLAAFLREAVRSEDTVARYGGEEFVLLVRGSVRDQVATMAERLRAGVEGLEIAHGDERIPITVTVGVAMIEDVAQQDDVGVLVARADSALYKGKREGRNRVVLG